MKEYGALFLSAYEKFGRSGVNGAIVTSGFQRRQIEERDDF